MIPCVFWAQTWVFPRYPQAFSMLVFLAVCFVDASSSDVITLATFP